jgi:hypothetical protein
MTLADRLAKHREVAEAAIGIKYEADCDRCTSASDEDYCEKCSDESGRLFVFRRSNSPDVTLAFIALAEADDPEPPMYDDEESDFPPHSPQEAGWHIAWRKRQELRANIDRVLGGGEE